MGVQEAIYLDPFYKQLLLWCDSVDVIRSIQTDVVKYPSRNDNFSNTIPLLCDYKPENIVESMQFSDTLPSSPSEKNN